LLNIYPAKSRSFVLSTLEQDACSRRKSQTTLWIECVGCSSSFGLPLIARDKSRFDNSTTDGARPDSERGIDKRSASYDLALCYSNETRLDCLLLPTDNY